MDLVVAFVFFAGAMAVGLGCRLPMFWAMTVGYFAFVAVGLHRGYRLGVLLKMSWPGAKNSLIVIRVLLLIGMLTGLWRSAGTFAFLVTWGMRLIRPSLFILAAYALSCGLSYAIGTSFGVAGTLGVALMALARGGGANELITAGAIMSGIYFGDRCSPASSCANLVASLTGTELYDNIRLMMKTSLTAVGCSCLFYYLLSLAYPMPRADSGMILSLEKSFNLTPWVIVPAVIMFVMPLLKVRPLYAFLASIACAWGCTVCFQHASWSGSLRYAAFGFSAEPGSAAALFNGGGLSSMLDMCAVLFISGTYSGIFDGTHMLDGLQGRLVGFMRRTSPFAALTLVGVIANGIFCNQTIGIMMTTQMMKSPYERAGLSRAELAQDIANSTVVTAGLIPWCIACSVPLAMLGVPARALPYAAYLYLLPLSYALMKRIWFKS
ncbi:Na+/H+ antiporter NhaC family protein [Pyramidobacter sp.]|uniref:Na+/H+ antiporter NhaC family protein n=2 Tax=Pyramidobacter sp. TaxID=1943581 RepID=UPI002A75913A|nr:Na+/H+ antiporter NhaC family protein [Pyramidobacter sp.]MDY3212768.1 Na+/H+ antiporter NhaC family protein [Pyramidobacter sp.]